MKDVFIIQKYNPKSKDEEAFVFSAMTRAMRESAFGREMSDEVFLRTYRKIIKKRLQEGMEVYVAKPATPAKPNEKEIFYGFIAFEKMGSVPVVHFLYTSKYYRNTGIAKKLLGLAVDKIKVGDKEDYELFVYTNHTVQAYKLRSKYPCIYNPFLFLLGKDWEDK